MEQHALPKSVCVELKEVSKRKRSVYDDDQIKAVTDNARHHGTAAAVRTYNKLHSDDPIVESTVRTWLKHFKDTSTYFSTSKRGRREALSSTEKVAALEAFDKLRAAPTSEGITARTFSAVAKGIVARQRPSALAKNGGALHLDRDWARRVLRKDDCVPLAKTTDRTVSDVDIAAASCSFFDSIRAVGAPRQLTFNMDEFAVILGSTNRKWTWQRASARRCVPIRQSKEAFTCSVLTSADGKLYELQMIWKGATATVHAQVETEHPCIVQDHQRESHFQDASTFARWCDRFAKYVTDLRENAGLQDAPAVLLLDAAPQHSDSAALARSNITVVGIPKKMTHVYQPADQYTISAIKGKVGTAWDDYVGKLFSSETVDQAVAQLTIRNAPILRSRMYGFLATAIDNLGAAPIVASWEVTGILREVWGDEPTHKINIDIVADRVVDNCPCGKRGKVLCEECEDWICRGCWQDHEAAWCPCAAD